MTGSIDSLAALYWKYRHIIHEDYIKRLAITTSITKKIHKMSWLFWGKVAEEKKQSKQKKKEEDKRKEKEDKKIRKKEEEDKKDKRKEEDKKEDRRKDEIFRNLRKDKRKLDGDIQVLGRLTRYLENQDRKRRTMDDELRQRDELTKRIKTIVDEQHSYTRQY